MPVTYTLRILPENEKKAEVEERANKPARILCGFGEVLAQVAQGSGGVIMLRVFRKHGDVALRDMVSGHSGDGLMVGPYDLGGLFQLNDYMILLYMGFLLVVVVVVVLVNPAFSQIHRFRLETHTVCASGFVCLLCPEVFIFHRENKPRSAFPFCWAEDWGHGEELGSVLLSLHGTGFLPTAHSKM